MEASITLKIQSLVYGGQGLGRLDDGRAAFVPFVMPDEVVLARIRDEKRGHVMTTLASVINAHEQRISPGCSHFGLCGGCQYQHIPYSLQLEFKKAINIEQLQRIAGIENPVVEKIVPSKNEWGYRNALQFSLSPEGKLCYADFYHNQPFAVKECHLAMPEISALWPQMEFEPGTQLERVEIRQNTEGDLMVVLRGDAVNLPEMETEATTSVVHLSGSDQVVMVGTDHLMMQVQGRDYKVSAGSFFQTNFSAAETILTEVQQIVRQFKCRSIMDVFCGVGLFSAALAEEAEQIIGVESSSAACEDFTFNLDQFENVSLYQGKAEQILPLIEAEPDCVILDPPRSGLKMEASMGVIEKSPNIIIYISCNPSTLARDMKYLILGGYKVASSTLVDMFPQTFHIESVTLFIKENV